MQASEVGHRWAANIPALTLTQGLRLAFSKDTHLLLAEFAQHHGPIFQIKYSSIFIYLLFTFYFLIHKNMYGI